ncbi:pectinesterase family protein [Streptomyces sp. NPDC048179]|uniref:pectinesterase family protein n=1 Tax=Streptomyces sp. NPDC048179 TaxID=3365506 RepID=UPI003712489E
MTDETHGRLSRRSFLGAAAVVSAAVTGGLVFVSAADAATGADASWQITSESADARAAYAKLLNDIRTGVSSHRLRPDNGRLFDVTDQDGTTQYIAVDLQAEDSYQMIRVFMRRSDAYVMGWRVGQVDADDSNTVYWGNFFVLDSVAAPNGAAPLPGATAQNTNTRFQNLANYSDLQQQGATRVGMQITPSSLSNAVFTLGNGANIAVGTAAQAILQIIVALAEASRFRNQAAATATAFGNGVPYTVTAEHIAQHNNWAGYSSILLGAVIAGTLVFSPEVEIAGAVYATAAAMAAVLMLAHHSGLNTKGKGLLEGTNLLVAPDGTGDYWTVQDAINAIPNSGANSIFVDKGTYNEVISVPASKPWLTIQGASKVPEDVVISYDRAHGTINPATGTAYGTQGSAVATLKAPNLAVMYLTITNTFDPAKHPEIDQYSTQAVALAALADRQYFFDVRLIARQDTVLCKSTAPTAQTRQYFANSYVEGAIDFIFGDATAVFDRCRISMRNWTGGTILAPNTDYRKTYGILIVGSEIFTNGVPDKTMYLGRPWHNVADAWPQAVVRDSTVHSGVNYLQPWTDMTPDYPWSWARFKEYNNYGPGAGYGSNAPQLTGSEAPNYTAGKYLAGTDGWNPVW